MWPNARTKEAMVIPCDYGTPRSSISHHCEPNIYFYFFFRRHISSKLKVSP